MSASVLVFVDTLTFSLFEEIGRLALQHRLATAAYLREFADAGGLISYGANLAEMYRRAAFYVDRILKGAVPRDLPIEQPSAFELVINSRTAKALGLSISPSLLARADRIIE